MKFVVVTVEYAIFCFTLFFSIPGKLTLRRDIFCAMTKRSHIALADFLFFFVPRFC